MILASTAPTESDRRPGLPLFEAAGKEFSVEVVEYEPHLLPRLTRAFNDALRGIPHCYPVDEKRLSRSLNGQLAERKRRSPLRTQKVFVAVDGGHVLGFVHTGTAHHDDETKGYIRFLWYQRGHRRAGQALLSAVENRFRKKEIRTVQAFAQEYTYPCYHLKPAYLSDRLGHVQALLAFEGYRRARGEVFLDWVDFEHQISARPRADTKVSTKKLDGAGPRPDIQVVAHVRDEIVGTCDCMSLAARTDADEARDWIFTTWLGVEEEHQGKGLGRLLLNRALHEAYALGYRHAAISTASDNHKACLFYSNIGYRISDWTYEYTTKLGHGR